MGFGSRKPNSNDPPKEQTNPWGSQNECYDDTAVLLNGDGKRCCVCRRVVLNSHLKVKDGKRYCPDHAPEGATQFSAPEEPRRPNLARLRSLHLETSGGEDGEAD